MKEANVKPVVVKTLLHRSKYQDMRHQGKKSHLNRSVNTTKVKASAVKFLSTKFEKLRYFDMGGNSI